MSLVRRSGSLVVLAAGVWVTACAPRIKPLAGEVAPVALPRTSLPAGHSQVIFDWEYSDPDLSGRGDGIARVAPPDSVRLDFFVAGGFIGGAAVLIRDSLQVPGVDMIRRLIPPPTLLWAVMGRSAFPVTRDTAIRLEGEFLRGDLGKPVEWRVTYRGDSLVRLEHIEGGRIVEWVERRPDDRIEYRQEAARRTLRLHITRVEHVGEFDAAIWRIAR